MAPGLRVRQGRGHEDDRRRARARAAPAAWTRRSASTTSRWRSTTTGPATRPGPRRRASTRRSATWTSGSGCASTSGTPCGSAPTRSRRPRNTPTGSSTSTSRTSRPHRPQGHCVEAGRGVIDIPGFLRTLVRINYRGVVSFEYEKDENDPLAGLGRIGRLRPRRDGRHVTVRPPLGITPPCCQAPSAPALAEAGGSTTTRRDRRAETRRRSGHRSPDPSQAPPSAPARESPPPADRYSRSSWPETVVGRRP